MTERQIDALLHKHLFGLPEYLDGWHPWEPEHYSTTWEGMGLVVEAMREKGFRYWGTDWIERPPDAIFCRYSSVDLDGGERFSHADTLPMAVALAALRALGVEVPAL